MVYKIYIGLIPNNNFVGYIYIYIYIWVIVRILPKILSNR